DADGVRIIGYANLPARLPIHASQLYARNVMHLVLHVWREGALHLDATDEIIAATLLVAPAGAAPVPAA
ncbi:MAG: hypothetical protein ABR559_06020, partial [Gemmatimonadota bacterium]